MSMTTLKELTWEAHKKAEQTPIMHALLKDEITPDMYSALVWSKYKIYAVIEQRVQFKNPELYRANQAFRDWTIMGSKPAHEPHELHLYVDHLRTLSDSALWSHVYVQYLAPLYGGQMIRRVIDHRFPVHMYEFREAAACIQEIRQQVTVDQAAEANRSFEMTTAYYQALWNHHAATH
jgi:heme oxygenase